MLLMFEKVITGEIHIAIHWYELNSKHVKDYDKNKESSYLKYCHANNLYGWKMSQKSPVNKFEWTEESSLFNEDFIKYYNEESDEGYLLEVQYPDKLHERHNDLPFLP